MNLQRIPFDPPGVIRGLDGCTGIARLGLCIRCDRLTQPGHQISPAAKRGALGVYECSNQVIGGVHVTTVPDSGGVSPSCSLGGVSAASHANKGVPND
jgi:hypothetical protein